VNPGSSKSSGKTGGNTEIRGLVARLVQKEKQVAQLQVDLENARGKSQTEPVRIHSLAFSLELTRG
jgi:hypothetical protein